MADPLMTLRQQVWKTRRMFRMPPFNRWADDWLKHWRGRQRSNAQSRRPLGVAGIDGPRHGPAADGSQKPNDAAAIPCAKAGSNPGAPGTSNDQGGSHG